MNETNLILEGVQLMLVGMGMVFVFLSVLVICTSLMQKIFKPSEKRTIAHDSLSVSAEEVAVISAAIHQHRSNRK